MSKGLGNLGRPHKSRFNIYIVLDWFHKYTFNDEPWLGYNNEYCVIQDDSGSSN